MGGILSTFFGQKPPEHVKEKIDEWTNEILHRRSTTNRWIVAIDFGTNGSGFALAEVKSKHQPVFVNKDWDDGDGTSYKTKTCILLTESGEFVAFGSHAENTFLQMDEEETKRHLFFETFKMALFDSSNTKAVSMNMKLYATDGRSLRASIVFTEALAYMRGKIADFIRQSTGGHELTEKDATFVLTVPAIWTDEAKQFMRNCAYKAGLVSRRDSSRLVLALEPEVASIHCRNLTTDDTVEKDVDLERQQPGDSYILLDAGGGTVDVAVHEIGYRNKVKEIHPPSGGPWGGSYCNQEICCFLSDIFGPQVLEHLKKTSPIGYIDLLKAVEDAKLTWGNHTDDPMCLKLNSDFRFSIDHVQSTLTPETQTQDAPQDGSSGVLKQAVELKDAIVSFVETSFHEAAGFPGEISTVEKAVLQYADQHKVHLRYRRETLEIGAATVRKLFDKVIDETVNNVTGLLKKPQVRKVSRLLLVGGFSGCGYFQQRITDAFGSKLQIVIPLDGGEAVMKGAVKFGQNPTVVTERIARFTYGIGCLNKFEDGVHPESKRHKVPGSYDHCDDIFYRMVEEGEALPLGKTVHSLASPLTDDQSGMSIPIYRSLKTDAKYTTDDGITMIGSLNIAFPSGYSGCENNVVDYALLFSSTEIHVIGVHRKSGEFTTTSLDFTSDV